METPEVTGGIITRPMYCPNHHTEAKKVIVYGGERKKLLIYMINYRVIEHITPHIISYVRDYDGMMPIAYSCGVLDCGVEIIDKDNLALGIRYLSIKTLELPIKEFKALLDFKNTGYELTDQKRRKW